MSNKTFIINTSSLGPVRRHDITWPTSPVNPAAFTIIARHFKTSRDYSPMTPRDLAELKRLVALTNKRAGGSPTVDQALAIRNVVVKDKIVKGFSRINANIGRIATQYTNGDDILDLSVKFDFPPLSLLRGIFLYTGYNATSIYSVFANKTTPITLLKGRDLKQYKRAEAGDAESVISQQHAAVIAAANEKAFVDYIRGLGIGLKTQDTLTEQQNAEFGRAVLTPDILFTDEVYINGARVYWIDYKDYIGTNIKFLLASNTKQALKYMKEWGPGAMCYHRSYISDVTIPNTLMLDVSALSLVLKC